MADYIEMMDKMRDKQQSAARPTRGKRSRKAVKPRRLTTRKKAAAIHRSVTGSRSLRVSRRIAAEETLAVKKARRSRKQIAAAKRNLREAHRKSRRRGAHESAALEPVKRGSRKAKLRGKKAAATRARNKRKRSAAARKGANSRKGGSAKRKPSKRSAKRKSPKRVAAGRRAARTRTRNREMNRKPEHMSRTEYDNALGGHERRRKARRKKNPIAATRRKRRKNPLPVAAAPRKRRKKNPIAAAPRKGRKYKRGKKAGHSTRGKGLPYTYHRRANAARRGHDRRRGHRIRRNPVAMRRRHNPIGGYRRSNPITGPAEFFAGVLGVGMGFAFSSFLDRLVCTHPYTASTGTTTMMDSPAVGQIYNSEAVALPVWQANTAGGMPWRLVAAGGSIVIPLGAAALINTHPALKSFFQLMGFAAVGKLAGKLIEDFVSTSMATNATVQQLYAPEIAAQAKLTGAASTALTPATPATFAGLPKGFRVGVGGVIQDATGSPYVRVGNTLYPAPPATPAPQLSSPVPQFSAAPAPRETVEAATPPAHVIASQKAFEIPATANWASANPDGRRE